MTVANCKEVEPHDPSLVPALPRTHLEGRTIMSARSVFHSERLSGRRLTLSFERIGTSHWSEAGKLRALVAELDRLEVPDSADIQLKHRTEDDELRPTGWSLNLHVPEAGPADPGRTQP